LVIIFSISNLLFFTLSFKVGDDDGDDNVGDGGENVVMVDVDITVLLYKHFKLFTL